MARVSIQSALAQAIADEINAQAAGTFVVDPTAVRSWADWNEQLEDLATLHVDVVPAGFESVELADRGEIEYRALTDIGIRQRFSTDDQAAATGRIAVATLDALDLLTEQLHEHFCADRVPSYLPAVWIETEYRSAFVRRHLLEFRQWTSIVRIKHDLTKPIGTGLDGFGDGFGEGFGGDLS